MGMGSRRTAMLLMLVAAPLCAEPAAKPIFTPPPMQWDKAMLSYRPALQQTAADFANLTGGIAFGMSPGDLNAKLPEPYPGLSWNALALANEYPGEVRYFGVPLTAGGVLRMDVASCPGSASYIVFMFSPKGLFRVSYRLVADKVCVDTNAAAQEIFGRYVLIGQGVALSLRYRTGKTEVVDISDPTAGFLIPVRWRQGGG